MTEEKDLSILYPKKFKCPICQQSFESMKLRESWLKIKKYDTDLSIVYYDVQPSFYQVIVCLYCGFAAIEAKYDKLRPAQKNEITRLLANKRAGKSYCQERTLDDGIVTWMLALGLADIADFASVELAMCSLNVARLFRLKGDEKSELRFTKIARDKLMEAYSEDDYKGAPGMYEGNACYLIGELSRRLGDKRNASTYMGMAMKNEDVKDDKRLMDMAREQWLLIKEME